MPSKGNTVRNGMLFLAAPMSPTDAMRLYDRNKSFRKLSGDALRALYKAGKRGPGQPAGAQVYDKITKVEAQAFVRSVCEFAVKIGNDIRRRSAGPGGKPSVAKPYPHPATVLYWVYIVPLVHFKMNPNGTANNRGVLDRMFGATATEQSDARGAIQILLSWAGIGSMSVGHLKPAFLWQNFVRSLEGAIRYMPNFSIAKVHGHSAPKSGQFAGVRLVSIKCRVPVGIRVNKASIGKMDAPALPFGYRTVTLQFAERSGGQLKSLTRFGEIWLGTSDKRKSLFLASQNKPGGPLVNLSAKGVEFAFAKTYEGGMESFSADPGDTSAPISPRIPAGATLPASFQSSVTALRRVAAQS